MTHFLHLADYDSTLTKKPRKIIHISNYFAPHIGGVEKHVAKIASVMQAHGHEVHVITQSHLPNVPDYSYINGVHVHRLPYFKPTTLFPKLTYKLHIWRNLWRLRSVWWMSHIIHVHDVMWWLMPFLSLIPRKKLFLTMHGYESGLEKPNAKQIRWKQWAFHQAQKSIGIGSFFEKWYRVSPTKILFGASDIYKSTQLTGKKKPGSLHITFVGRLEPEHGLLELLQAVKSIHKYKKLLVTIYGDGSLRNEAEEFTKKYKLPVHFTGFVEDIVTPFQQADMVMASGYLAIIEALQMQKPVMAWEGNEAHRTYLANTPFSSTIIRVATPQEIEKNLTKKITTPAKKTVAWVREQTWQKVAKAYYQLWQIDDK